MNPFLINNFLNFYCIFILFFICIFSWFVANSLNPISAILCLIVVFLLTSSFLLFIGVEFLAFAFIIIYVGAIAMLFIFTILLLDMKNITFHNRFQAFSNSFFFVFFTFLIMLLEPFNRLSEYQVYIFSKNIFFSQSIIFDFFTINDVEVIGQILYTFYPSFFLISGFILFLSVICSLSLVLDLNTNKK